MNTHGRVFSKSKKGFSLVEVVLAIGVLALTTIALVGLMGPSFKQARTITDNNAATAAIGKLNSAFQQADFETIINLVSQGGAGLPAGVSLLFIYQEEYVGPFDASLPTRYRDRVAYHTSANITEKANDYGWMTYSELYESARAGNTSNWRAVSPIIVMALSLSPIANDLVDSSGVKPVTYNDPYLTGSTLFPTYAAISASSYTYGMLPVMVSVFVIQNIDTEMNSADLARTDVLKLNRRLFTFQAAKLR